MEKFTIEQAKANVENSFGTIYSKEDVLKILNSIQVESEPSESIINITSEQYDELAGQIARNVAEAIERMDCISGWDLSMSYNEVSVDNLEVNDVEIEEIVEDVINKWVVNIKEDNDCDC